MGNYSAGLEHAQAASKFLEPHSTVLVKENEVCRAYQTALELLVEMKAAEESDDQVMEAILARFLGDLVIQPKHRLVLMRMAATKNFEVGNFGIAARFIRVSSLFFGEKFLYFYISTKFISFNKMVQNLLKLGPADESSLDAKLQLCQENKFNNLNIPKYECPQCHKNVSPAPISCTVCNIPIQSKYYVSNIPLQPSMTPHDTKKRFPP